MASSLYWFWCGEAMCRRRLRIYLNDHLAALSGVESRARFSADENDDAELVAALLELAHEAADDREALREVSRRLGVGRVRLKELSVLMLERAGRLKLNGRLVRYSPLSRIEELEFLAAGAALNERVWESLEILREELPSLDGIDVSARRLRAKAREENLLRLRRKWVRAAFL